MIKKILCITMVIFTLVGVYGISDLSVSAEGAKFTDTANNFFVEFPQGWGTITKDTPESDEAYTKYEYYYEKIQPLFIEDDCIVISYFENSPVDIRISAWEDDESKALDNFIYEKSKYDAWEKKAKKLLVELQKEGESKITFDDRKTSAQAIYTVYDMAFTESPAKIKYAITVVNGKMYCVELFSYDGNITPQDMQNFDMTIHKLHFLEVNKKKSVLKKILYTDSGRINPSTKRLVRYALGALVIPLFFGVRSKSKKKKRNNDIVFDDDIDNDQFRMKF